MKVRPGPSNHAALTLVEVLVIIAVVAVLVIMFIPTHPRIRKNNRINCINNLKQVGLAYRIWALDHGDKYPFEVFVTIGGTKELTIGDNAWRNCLVISNELSTPLILLCPEDKTHIPAATNFSAQMIGHISYLVGLDATEEKPQTILSGDANFEMSGMPVKSGLLELTSNSPVAWDGKRHGLGGNIALADGSVHSISNSELAGERQRTGLATNHFAIP